LNHLQQRAAFIWGVILVTGAKLWLTSEIRIVPLFMPHDAENYVEHARDILGGAWFGAYSDLTLIKEPFYPIYLALVHETGLTLPVATTLVYALACVIACIAVRPLVRNGFVLLAMYVVLLFNPMTFGDLAWMVSRSELNDSLALFTVACAMAIFVRRRSSLRGLLVWWVGLGLSLGAFWLTREESIWILPCLIVILGAYIVSIRRDPALVRKLCALAIPIAIWALSEEAIARINQHVYGWHVVVETKAPEFVSAYNSLARIVPDKPVDLTPVPRSSRNIAYRVSPAARELRAGLDGQNGNAWTQMVCKANVRLSCNDIPGSFFVWAFRDSVQIAGHYSSGSDARDFYLRLAREIDAACDSGAIRCTRKATTIFPNPTLSQIPDFLTTFHDGVSMTTGFSDWSLGHNLAPVNRVLEGQYAFVTGSILQDVQVFQGWLATDRAMDIALEGPAGIVPIEGVLRSPSGDVAASLERGGHRRWEDQNARFAFAADCLSGCFFLVTDPQKHQVKIPIDIQAPNFATLHVIYHLDSAISPAVSYNYQLKEGTLFMIDVIYHDVVPLWVLLAAMLLLGRTVRAIMKARVTVPSPPDVLSVGVVLGGGLLIAILAVLTLSYSAAYSAEYLGSFVPLMLFALSLTTAVEGRLALRALRLRLRGDPT